MYNKIVLAIPHSVRQVVSEYDNVDLLNLDADRWTDWYTDVIFACDDNRIESVIGTVSRFDCDLERLEDDPLSKVGRGILYTTTHSGANRLITAESQNEWLWYWYDYRSKLVSAIVENTLIIDCHSFPSDIADVDICLGYNDDGTKPPIDVIEMMVKHFMAYGFTVKENDPYSNSISPVSNLNYHSIMVELNKRLYLDEINLQRLPFDYKLHNCLQHLYRKLLE